MKQILLSMLLIGSMGEQIFAAQANVRVIAQRAAEQTLQPVSQKILIGAAALGGTVALGASAWYFWHQYKKNQELSSMQQKIHVDYCVNNGDFKTINYNLHHYYDGITAIARSYFLAKAMSTSLDDFLAKIEEQIDCVTTHISADGHERVVGFLIRNDQDTEIFIEKNCDDQNQVWHELSKYTKANNIKVATVRFDLHKMLAQSQQQPAPQASSAASEAGTATNQQEEIDIEKLMSAACEVVPYDERQHYSDINRILATYNNESSKTEIYNAINGLPKDSLVRKSLLLLKAYNGRIIAFGIHIGTLRIRSDQNLAGYAKIDLLFSKWLQLQINKLKFESESAHMRNTSEPSSVATLAQDPTSSLSSSSASAIRLPQLPVHHSDQNYVVGEVEQKVHKRLLKMYTKLSE